MSYQGRKALIPNKSGEEHDYFTRWRRYLNWNPGVGKWIKKTYHRKVRQDGKRKIRDAYSEEETSPDDNSGCGFRDNDSN